MRILNIIQTLDRNGGGTVEWVRLFSSTGVYLGHQIDVLTLDAPDAPCLRDTSFVAHGVGSSLRGFYAPKLVDWIRRHHTSYDCIVIHGLWRFASFGTWLALRRSSTPYFVYTHGMLDPWFKSKYPIKHAAKWLYWPWADYQVLRDAAAVIYTCEEERLKARLSFSLYSCNERVAALGIAKPDGDPTLLRRAFHTKYPQTRDKHLLLFLGRLHEKKGCENLIKAFAGIAGCDCRLHLVMAGPGHESYVNRLTELATQLGVASRITWPGMLVGDLKWGAFYSADAFVLPSHQENFGIAVVEAMACGTPVLISNKVDIWREIVDDKAGIVGNDTLEGTTAILKQWLDSTDERPSMKRNARQCYTKRFEINSAIHSLLTLLSEGTFRLPNPIPAPQ